MKPGEILLKMEQIFDLICDNSDDQSNSAPFSSETDPLEEFGAEGSEGVLAAIATKPSFYRMNNIVFAEPLQNTKTEDISSKDCEYKDEITILDSVTIRKKTGKIYKKYQFNIEESSPTKCPQLNCLRTFPTKKHLTAHIRRVHCADRKRYICDQCGRGFPEPHILSRHADTHSEKTVECPVCKVKLSKRTSLSTHLRSHSNQRPHECLVCKKKFARASSMATHVKFVHREGLLECDKCDKSHLRSHANIRLHECGVYKKNFARASSMATHVKFVHRERLLECNERFSSRKQWSLHTTTHRKKNPTPQET